MYSLISWLRSHWFITLITVGYLVTGFLYAVFTPQWQAPDEPAHYNYVAQVARSGCCPKIEPGDWDQAYLEQLTSTGFALENLSRLDAIQYEDHQPPLFYLLAAPVYQLVSGSLTALRFFSVVMGAGVVVCVYAAGRTLLPERPQVAAGAAALVAFLPQNVAIMASVNNDSLANSLVGFAVLLVILYLQGYRVRAWWLGLLVGLGLLTKLSTLFLVGLVPLVILMRWRRDRLLSTLVRELTKFAVPAIFLSGIWIARNIGVYGFPDVFGLRQHDLVVADQLRTADLIAQMGFGEYLNMALNITFTSFWGQFGWMALPLPDWIRLPLLGLLVASLVGLGLNTAMRSDLASHATATGRRDSWIILTVTLVLVALAYVYYNTEFVQFQGRYMYAGLLPFALFMALGLDGWRRALVRWLPATRAVLRPWVITLPFLAFAALDVYLLFRVIVPGLTPGVS